MPRRSGSIQAKPNLKPPLVATNTHSSQLGWSIYKLGVCASSSLQMLPRQRQRPNDSATLRPLLKMCGTRPLSMSFTLTSQPLLIRPKLEGSDSLIPTTGDSFVPAPIYKHVGTQRCQWDCL